MPEIRTVHAVHTSAHIPTPTRLVRNGRTVHRQSGIVVRVDGSAIVVGPANTTTGRPTDG